MNRPLGDLFARLAFRRKACPACCSVPGMMTRGEKKNRRHTMRAPRKGPQRIQLSRAAYLNSSVAFGAPPPVTKLLPTPLPTLLVPIEKIWPEFSWESASGLPVIVEL